MSARRHEHEFTALWYNLGPHGRQGIHLHACFTQGCSRVLVGPGSDCDGTPRSHQLETLGGRWSKRENGGKPPAPAPSPEALDLRHGDTGGRLMEPEGREVRGYVRGDGPE